MSYETERKRFMAAMEGKADMRWLDGAQQFASTVTQNLWESWLILVEQFEGEAAHGQGGKAVTVGPGELLGATIYLGLQQSVAVEWADEQVLNEIEQTDLDEVFSRVTEGKPCGRYSVVFREETEYPDSDCIGSPCLVPVASRAVAVDTHPRVSVPVSEAFTLLMRDITEQGPERPEDERTACVNYDWLYERIREAFTAATQPAPSVPDLDDEVRWILGRPNFTCIEIAQKLRDKGYEIQAKSEDEQAAVIHWMLGLYAEHGKDWRKEASALLTETPAPPAEGAE